MFYNNKFYFLEITKKSLSICTAITIPSRANEFSLRVLGNFLQNGTLTVIDTLPGKIIIKKEINNNVLKL